VTLRTKKFMIVVLVVAVGAAILFSSVARKRSLIDQDEAACIFSGYYWELYRTGKWNDPIWHEFMEYAEHPPGGGYLYGLMLNMIGKPVKTIEPRRYWFQNSLDPTYFPNKFHLGLQERYSEEQVVVGRYVSAVIALLTALIVMLMLFRLSGFFEGVAGFILLMIHPAFVYVGTIATFDIFVIFLSVITIFLTMEVQRNGAQSTGRIAIIGLCTSVTLGISLLTKISAYALLPAMFICVAVLSRSGRHFLRGICALFCIAMLACVISYVLDPASHGDPIGTLIERTVWRIDRIEIQQITSPAYALQTYIDRLKYALYELFFSGTGTLIGFILFVSGILSVIALGKRGRERFLIVSLALYFMVINFALLPLAWIRYISAYIPFIILVEGLGAGLILSLLKGWVRLTGRVRASLLISLLVSVSVGGFAVRWLASNHLPSITVGEANLAPAFGYSISQPGKDAKLHRLLYDHFKSIGNEKRAVFQLKQLEKMEIDP
jgi:hypothetical protein